MRHREEMNIRAFTMVELMGAVTIAMVLIFLLYSIFDKVQTVFVAGQNRAKAMEAGRTAMDLLVDDMQALAGGVDGDLENVSWEGTSMDPNYQWNDRPTLDYVNYLIENPMGLVRVPNSEFIATDGSGRVAPQLPPGAGLPLYHHHCRLLTHDDSWQFVHYRFGPREKYHMQLTRSVSPPHTPMSLRNSPVGALWVYRSPRTLKSKIMAELVKHQRLVAIDSPAGLDEPVGFSKLIDGVIHFRVTVSDPTHVVFPNRSFRSFVSGESTNPFRGFELPRYVLVELAVLDKKLLKEVEAGMEQQLEGMPVEQQRGRRLAYIAENLDRVYFFKQLIRIRNPKEGL